MQDLLVYRREGKHISDDAEFINTSDICFVTAERESPKSDYRIILTTLEREYVTYAKNVDSFVTAISKLDNFSRVDRGVTVNLLHEIDYNKDLGQLIYKNINYKRNNRVVVGKKYEKSVKDELIKLGKWE